MKLVAQKGTYALILKAETGKHINVGRLGKMQVHPGFYLYVGSACGPGGLKARLSHHLKRITKPHWHIDYLRRYTKVIEIWYTTDGTRREDHWVTSMLQLPHITIACPGFGASDSSSASHLFMSAYKPDFTRFCALMAQIPNHAPIHLEQRLKT